MINLLNHLAAALTGAVQLARFNASGMRYFDFSTIGFWRSFLAAGIVAPFFIALLVIRHSDNNAAIFIHHICLESLTFLIAWLLFPLALFYVTIFIDRRNYYVPYIVAYNWSGAIQNGFSLPIAILSQLGVLSSSMANMLALAAMFWVISFTFFVTRAALQVKTATAVSIVLFDLTLGIFIELVSNQFLW